MIKVVSYLMLILPLFLSACAPSTSTSIKKIARTPNNYKQVSYPKTIAFQEKKEIIEWEKALKLETRRLVNSGYNKLDEIIKNVSENTHELEQPARIAYINECIEISKFGNELALEATKELHDREFDKSNQEIPEQVNKMMEDNCKKTSEEKFSERKHRLIEKYSQQDNVSQKYQPGP